MFDIQKYLDELDSIVRKSNLSRTYLSQVSWALNYLKQQSLCDFDRRDPPNVIKSRWDSFEELIRPTPLDNLLKKDKNRWLKLQRWTGASKLIQVDNELLVSQKSKPRFHDQEAKELFQLMHRETLRLKFLSDAELRFARTGLMYLSIAAERARFQRDPKEMELVWRWIHPLLKKAGALDIFRTEPEAIKKIRNCIKDKPL